MASHATATQPRTAQQQSQGARQPRPQRGIGYDMRARQQNSGQGGGRTGGRGGAQQQRESEQRGVAVGAYMTELASRYVVAADETVKSKSKGRVRPMPFAGTVIGRQAAIKAEGMEYRSNEEALPSRHGDDDGDRGRGRGRGDRGRGDKGRGDRGRGRGASQPRRSGPPAPAYNALTSDFGPALPASSRPVGEDAGDSATAPIHTQATPLPVLWGPGMYVAPLKPVVEAETETETATATEPNTAPAAPAAPLVWGDAEEDEDEEEFVPLAPGQAWGASV